MPTRARPVGGGGGGGNGTNDSPPPRFSPARGGGEVELRDRFRLAGAGGGGDFGGEIAFLLLDALAQLEADIGGERDGRAGVLAGGRDDVLDLRLVVHDEDLAHQRVFLAELGDGAVDHLRSEEHTSELKSLMRISYAVFCL